MQEPKYTRVVLAQNGRHAIMARKTENDPWVQIESALDEEDGLNWASRFEHDDEERAITIDEMADEDWADDAPAMEVK